MHTAEELRKFYDTDLMPPLTELETVRKSVLKRIIKYSIITIVTVVILGFVLSLVTTNIQTPLIIIAVIGIGIIYYIYYTGIKNYTSSFKDSIIQKLIHFIDTNLNYSKDKCISQSVYMSSRIFPKMPDRYSGDDYVSGKLGQTEVEFSELHTEYKTETTDSRGNRQTSWHRIFKGLFFIADFNKNFNTSVVVLPDTAEKYFGKLLGSMFQSWNITRDKLIKLEDPEFEKYFVVYSNDQIEARYILSTSLMKRIVDFKKKSGKDIHISFVNSKIFVAISYNENLFEPRVFSTLLNFEPIQKYYNDLSLAIGLVEELNLNTRIWSKQ